MIVAIQVTLDWRGIFPYMYISWFSKSESESDESAGIGRIGSETRIFFQKILIFIKNTGKIIKKYFVKKIMLEQKNALK
jgi:hypothetical protein